MHKASRLLLLVSCALLLCSCASGLSPREYGSTDYADLLYELYREEPESTEPKLLSMPVKLGVAQIGEVAPHQATLAELRKHPQVISNVIELPLPGGRRSRRNQEPVPQLRTDALRRLGRELGADYVFLFGGSVDTSSRSSGWSFFDVTIIGAFIVPSVTFDTEAKGAGALIDVEDGRVVFLVSAEKNKQDRAPSALARGKQEKVHMELRDDLVLALSRQLVQKMSQRD